jgi:hypothetical protein
MVFVRRLVWRWFAVRQAHGRQHLHRLHDHFADVFVAVHGGCPSWSVIQNENVHLFSFRSRYAAPTNRNTKTMSIGQPFTSYFCFPNLRQFLHQEKQAQTRLPTQAQ